MSYCPPKPSKTTTLFYEGKGVTIYCADSAVLIPKLERKFDWLVCDPPYGTGSTAGYGRQQNHRNEGKRGREIHNDESLETFQQVVEALSLEKVCSFCSPKKIGEMVIICNNLFLQHRAELIWNKKTPGMGSIRYQHETILVFSQEDLNLKSQTSIFDAIAPSRKGIHPHEKPINVVGSILDILKPESVIDPFMGTGVLAVACAERGIKYTGIEIEKRYCELAVQRLKQDLLF